MEKKPPLVMTPFDESLTNDFLQLVKIILPYLPDHVQRIAGIYVKLTELMNAFYCFQPPYYHNRRGRLRKQEKDPGSMFEAVVPYLSPEKREMFDSFSGIWPEVGDDLVGHPLHGLALHGNSLLVDALGGLEGDIHAREAVHLVRDAVVPAEVEGGPGVGDEAEMVFAHGRCPFSVLTRLRISDAIGIIR